MFQSIAFDHAHPPAARRTPRAELHRMSAPHAMGAAVARQSSRALGWAPLNYERFEARAGERLQLGAQHEHQVLLVLSGGRVRIDQQHDQGLKPGTVVLLPAGRGVGWEPRTSLAVAVLALEAAALQRVAVEIFGQAPSTAALPETMRDSDGGIATIAGVLARETATATPESAVYAEALGSMLAVHLMRHYSAGSASPASTVQRGAALPLAVARAARYIRDNLARDVRLADVARAAHVSPFHLTRQFKEAMGLSPYQYVLRERVNAAKAMLQAARSDLTLAELALAVGFADQSHLTRHFKRAVGVTPNAYRAQLAAGDAASRAVQ